ncbi:MAG TPA: amino acid adenylation domain-containing protein [Herpetosiphonaceae bacterium]
MPNSIPLSCYIIGEGSLPIQCAEILIAQGHTIHGIISTDPAIRRWADERHIPHTHPRNDLPGFMSRQPFDYLFSIVNPVILPAEILSLPRKAAINYHDAPLPTYAGSFATFWALIDRRTTHGITWHQMSVLVDAGDILKQRMVEIGPRETTFTLNTRCYEAAIQAFAELVTDLAADRLLPIRQNLAERSFFAQSKRPPMGGVIAWEQPAETIGALARALDFGPYPNAMGRPKLAIGSEFLIVAELEELGTHSTAASGTISRIDRESIQVATTTTDIALRELLTIDGRDLPLAEVVAIFGLRQGQQLPALPPERAERLTALNTAFGRHEAFWTERLAALHPIALPFVERQTPGVAVEPERITMPISDAVRSYLAGAAQDFNSLLRTAFVAYLARIGGMDRFDLGFSSAALRRELGELDRFFASMLPLRVEVLPERSYAELAQALDAQVALVARHKTYARDMTTRYPVLRELPERRGPALPVGVVEIADRDDVLPPADLILALAEADATCVWLYNPAVLDAGTVERMARSFQVLLESIVADPEQRIGDLPLLDEAERQRVLVDWNATTVAYPPERYLHTLFEAQAARTPDAPTLITVGDDEQMQRLSYRQLNARANQLAHHLRCLGVGPDVPVGICAERSVELVVGLLGILKAGGAYLPLDPSYPRERLSFMLQDSLTRIVLAQEPLVDQLPAHSGSVLCLDRDWPTIAQSPATEPHSTVNPDQLAYIIYTSGSTGRPKGVMLTQRGLSNYLHWAVAAYGAAQGQGAPVHSPIGFDLTVTSLFTPLLCGRSVWLLPQPQPVEALADRLKAQADYSLVKLTPAHLDLLRLVLPPDTLAGQARAFVIGGEALHYETIALWRQHAPATRLINEYGPTETVVGCCIYEVTPDDAAEGAVPIGRPIANTQIYLLDARLQPVPIGVPGEIYIGGAQLARGYTSRPDLTAAAFIPDPFSNHPGARLYRTGDLARYQADGVVEFLGRIDQQVKLRGYRIELGEIEALLGQHPAVEQAVVLVQAQQSAEQRLIAYVVENREPRTENPELNGTRNREQENKESTTTPPRLSQWERGQGGEGLVSVLHTFLQRQLPDYMVPTAILLLDEMPLTSNGKIDRKALAKLNWIEASRSTPFVAPRSPLEEALVSIWRDSCRLSHIGINDNFFKLGGNSLTATQIVSRVQRAFHIHLTIRDIFAAPTIAALARHLRTHERQPGQLDRVSVALLRLWTMSPEERQRVLQQKAAKGNM